MRPIRLHPRVYDDIDEALANTREQFGPRRVLLYARLISKGRQTLRRHPTIVSCVKISVLEYVCIASRRIESMRHMATSIECTRTAPSTSRASFISPGTCLTSQIGGSEQRHRGDANCEVAAARTVASRGSTLSTQKRGVSFR